MYDDVYSVHARILHWLTVVLLLGLMTVGLLLGTFRGELGNQLYFYHKSFGMLLFLVVLWRLGRRIVAGVPEPSPHLTTFQRNASELVHSWLYGLMLLMPIAGYVLVAAFPAPLDFFGLTAPNVIQPDRALSGFAADVHFTIAVALGFLIAVHVSAALYHHFVRKDDVLSRMIPSLKRKRR